MELKKFSEHTGRWLQSTGPFSDIVISSRIRLARNLAGFEFVPISSPENLKLILGKLSDTLLAVNISAGKFYVDISRSSQLDRDFLIERHLISKQFSTSKNNRGAIISDNEDFSAMINEEDHLRMAVLLPGLQLENCWQRLNDIDDQIEKHLEYAFHPRLGYLTACPTNLGTGIRVSVMLHLPGLKITGHLEKFFSAAKAMNLAVRGLFGEGTEAIGDFFQVSNQTTLGIREEDVVKQFSKYLIPDVVRYEELARLEMINKKASILDDKIYRAYGILKHAQMISSHEALYLLSHLRLGINLKRIEALKIDQINRLFLLTQPAHLQYNSGGPLTSDERDQLRAKIIRESLN